MDREKILFYDIETLPLKAYVWRCGKQVVRHAQLDKKHNQYNIICITYCWNDGEPAKALVFNKTTQSCKGIVKKFDKLVEKADVVIGKNSDKFDNKHINFQRLMHGLPPKADWIKYTDDLERHMRRYFVMPSFALDYFSDILGLGGKNPMQFSDWIEILEKGPNYLEALDKMVTYGIKDIEDTRALWDYCEAHFEKKLNNSVRLGDIACKNCGSKDIRKNGTRTTAGTKYQAYYCNDHGGYAGRHPINTKHPKVLR